MASRKDYDDVQQLMKQPPKSFLSKLASLFFFSKHSEGPRDDSKLQTPRSKQTYFGAFLNFATSWLSIFGSKPKSSHQPMQSSADTLNPVSPLLVAVRVGV